MTLTIRQIAERCKARHFVDESSDGAPHPERPWCGFCFHSWPCPDYADAVAALRAIDEAKRLRIIPQDQFHPREEYTTHPPSTHALVTDPAPPTENT